MKIAFLNIYQNKVARGAETFVKELAARLSKNHEVDILTALKLKKRYDVLIPTNGRLQVLIARVLTWLNGSKMIVSGQSGPGLDDRINLLAFPDIFVAISMKALSWAKRVNPLVRSVYIPNGVDLSKFRDRKGGSNGGVVLCVGAFTREKRHDLVIKAVAMLKNTSLIIVGGGGEQKKEIEVLGRRLLDSRFKIMQVPHQQMPQIYTIADVFTYPTVPWESFGISMVEAMASGLPVVATDDPVRREIVGDAGLFVDPTDIEAYAKALEKALRTDWGNKPRKQAEKFDWDKIALEYEKLFKELIK